MRRRPAIWFVAITCVLLVGCRTKQLRHDQEAFRCALLDMETDQIMDNLIRAKMGLPIVHVDYDRISGTVTQGGSEDLRGSYTDVVGGAVTRVISGGLLAAKQENQLTVTGNPVRDKPEVYISYLRYLDLEDGLMCTHEPPPPGAAHLCRTCNGVYYWVPVNHRGDFFKLAMQVTGLRGDVVAPPAYIEFKIVGVTDVQPKVPDLTTSPQPDEQHEFTVKISPPLAKGDEGKGTVSINGWVVPLQFRLPKGADGVKTETLIIEYSFGTNIHEGETPIHPLEFMSQLAGKTIQFYPSRFKPEPPKRDVLLESIRDELNAIRLDGLRQP